MLKTGDRAYVFHDGAQKRARIVTVDEGLGFATVTFTDKSEALVSISEIAPLYRWDAVEMDGVKVGERPAILFEINGVKPTE